MATNNNHCSVSTSSTFLPGLAAAAVAASAALPRPATKIWQSFTLSMFMSRSPVRKTNSSSFTPNEDKIERNGLLVLFCFSRRKPQKIYKKSFKKDLNGHRPETKLSQFVLELCEHYFLRVCRRRLGPTTPWHYPSMRPPSCFSSVVLISLPLRWSEK